MALRTGTISQQTRAARDKETHIRNIQDEIYRHRREIHDLQTILHRVLPRPEQAKAKGRLAAMTEKALDKLTNKNGTPFVRPTRMRVRTPFHPRGESMTQQHSKDECDINFIIRQHQATGNISHLNQRQPLYVDCTSVADLQGAIQLVEEAEDNFATLPSAVRAACGNDPVEFVRMWDDEEAREELVQAGLRFHPAAPQGARDPSSSTADPAQPDLPATPQPEAGGSEGKTPLTPQGGE